MRAASLYRSVVATLVVAIAVAACGQEARRPSGTVGDDARVAGEPAGSLVVRPPVSLDSSLAPSGAPFGTSLRVTTPGTLTELLVLRRDDIDWVGSVLTISRAVSVDEEGPTKCEHARQVPLADHAAAALERASRRRDVGGLDDYVFCNAYGRRLDGPARCRRFKSARDTAGLRQLR